MKEMIKVRKEFILEAHSEACNEWKTKIEKEVPELFKDKLEVGKWYKFPHGVACLNELNTKNNYGFFNGAWKEDIKFLKDHVTGEATDKEVSDVLIKEAEKRGFKEGVQISGKSIDEDWYSNSKLTGSKFTMEHYSEEHNEGCKNSLLMGCLTIFYKGKWATIIPKVTIEDVQKMTVQEALENHSEIVKEIFKLK